MTAINSSKIGITVGGSYDPAWVGSADIIARFLNSKFSDLKQAAPTEHLNKVEPFSLFWSSLFNKKIQTMADELFNDIRQRLNCPTAKTIELDLCVGVSLGGIVLKELIAQGRLIPKTFVTVASPHDGASKLVHTLSGLCCGPCLFTNDAGVVHQLSNIPDRHGWFDWLTTCWTGLCETGCLEPQPHHPTAEDYLSDLHKRFLEKSEGIHVVYIGVKDDPIVPVKSATANIIARQPTNISTVLPTTHVLASEISCCLEHQIGPVSQKVLEKIAEEVRPKKT